MKEERVTAKELLTRTNIGDEPLIKAVIDDIDGSLTPLLLKFADNMTTWVRDYQAFTVVTPDEKVLPEVPQYVTKRYYPKYRNTWQTGSRRMNMT